MPPTLRGHRAWLRSDRAGTSLQPRLVPRVQGRRNLVEDIRRCLRSPYRFLGGTGWPSGLLLSRSLRGAAPTFRSQCSLKVLRWYARRRPLLPRHLWPTFTVDEDELFPGRASRELEQPDTFRAGRTNFALGHRLLLRSGRLRLLGLYLGLYFGGGPHLSYSCLTGYSCCLPNATDFGFFLRCPPFLVCHCFSPV